MMRTEKDNKNNAHHTDHDLLSSKRKHHHDAYENFLKFSKFALALDAGAQMLRPRNVLPRGAGETTHNFLETFHHWSIAASNRAPRAATHQNKMARGR